MAPDHVELHSWEWKRGKVSHPVYLDHERIFRRFRFSLPIHFLCHFALMIKHREGVLVSLFSGRSSTCLFDAEPQVQEATYKSLQTIRRKGAGSGQYPLL